MKSAKQRSNSQSDQVDFQQQQLLLDPPPITFSKVKDNEQSKLPAKEAEDKTHKKISVKMNAGDDGSDKIEMEAHLFEEASPEAWIE